MVNSVDHIAEQLFKVIKGFGHTIVLFTDEGKKTVDPTEARRFYAKDLQMMVNFVADETTNEIIVNLSSGTDIKDVKPMLAAIRNLANRYIIEYTVKTFGKSIEPRDFAYQAKSIREAAMNNTVNLSGLKFKQIDQQHDKGNPDEFEDDYISKTYAVFSDEERIGELTFVSSPFPQLHGNLYNKTLANVDVFGSSNVKKALKIYLNSHTGQRWVKNLSKYQGLSRPTNDYRLKSNYESTKTEKHNVQESKTDQQRLDRLNDVYDGLKQDLKTATSAHSKKEIRDTLDSVDRRITKLEKKMKNETINEISDKPVDRIQIGMGDTRSAQELKDQIRNLSDESLLKWAEKLGGRFGTRVKKLQDKLIKSELRRRNMTNETLEEGFSGWHGSARKSVNELGDARIIVRHKRNVDEEKRGARTRQIESIFIENAEGERFKFPSTNITAAKAMARHVQEGGAPFDDFGQHIYGIMEELNQLKKFSRKNRRNDFFEDAAIGEEINSHIGNLRGNLKKMASPKGYSKQFENFTAEHKEVPQERIDELKDAATISYFDESITDSLPYVARVIENLRGRQAKEAEIVDLARYVMANKDNIQLTSPIDNDDPENPSARQFRDPATAFAAWVTYIAPKLKDDTLANKLMAVADLVHEIGGKHLNTAAAAINVIRQKATVAESNHIEDENVDVEEAEISRISESLSKYNLRDIFDV